MIKETSVIGAGIMGHSIAQAYALKNFRVRLYDNSARVIGTVKRSIDNDLSLMVEEGLIGSDKKQQALDNIIPVDKLDAAVAGSDFITEAIPENLELKCAFLKDLEHLIKDETIVASNTSTFPISKLAANMARPERLIITHFFNPAHLVPLVEIVKMEKTLPPVITETVNLMKTLGKKPVVLKKEVPGFIANRLQAALFRETLFLLQNDVADARDIDTAVTSGPGFRWSLTGPVAIADFGGLDTWCSVMQLLMPELDCSKSAPEILTKLVDRGDLGTKTGGGFYQYDDQSNSPVEEQIRHRDRNFIRQLKIRQ